MQALILAAGMGTRLKQYTVNNTKCMVDVAGKRIIDRALDSISFAGINNVVIVIGYKGEQLREYIEKEYSNSNITFHFIENKMYATTNNIYSLYLTREYIVSDDTILIESDIVFERDLIKRIIKKPYDNIAVVDHYESWMNGTIVTEKNGIVTKFIDSKSIGHTSTDNYFKTVNIYKLSKEFCRDVYLPQLRDHVERNLIDLYYEDVLKNIIRVSSKPIINLELVDSKWYEIDDPHDLDVANIIFSDDERRYELLTSKFGGYWRYPGILDFNLIVNPFYPSKDLMTKICSESDKLIVNYPSNLDVQRDNAENVFGVKPEYLIVGNGASELINILGRLFKGKITVPVPTFNEYIRCFPECEISIVNNKDNGFIPSMDEYLLAAQKSDIMCIVNPDNPSGNMFTLEELFLIADECKRYDTKLVVDESFIDFADSESRFTLLDNEIMKKYPNLVVIKSLGKTHGIPGLRLGVLASGDKSLIKVIKEHLPIWNINHKFPGI